MYGMQSCMMLALCKADPVPCIGHWIDMRAQLEFVCECFAQPGDSVRAWHVASAVRSGSDRSYLFRVGFIPSGSYRLYTFRQALPPSEGDPPNSMRA